MKIINMTNKQLLIDKIITIHTTKYQIMKIDNYGVGDILRLDTKIYHKSQWLGILTINIKNLIKRRGNKI